MREEIFKIRADERYDQGRSFKKNFFIRQRKVQDGSEILEEELFCGSWVGNTNTRQGRKR
ncbi:MAG: hypothetical protein Q4A75_02205 [Peptostreptococcaceae bacterium]|nr:hypothetical protein [Peptostreptococcaceae bacterium]